MSYVQAQLRLSPKQLEKLLMAYKMKSAISLRLSAQALTSGSTPVYLTKTQVIKLAKCAAAGVGCQINFSAKQLHFNAKVGSGLFGDILGKVADIGVNLAADAGKDLISYGGKINKLTGQGFFGDLARTAVSKVADAGIDLAGNAAKDLVTYGGKQIVKTITGGTARKPQKGKGLYAPGYGGRGIYAPGN
jgi:hypothetical protein